LTQCADGGRSAFLRKEWVMDQERILSFAKRSTAPLVALFVGGVITMLFQAARPSLSVMNIQTST
jgi:hypothetical protein